MDAQCHQTPLNLPIRVVLLLELLLGALQQGGILIGCPRPLVRPWTQEPLPPLLTSRLATSRHTLRDLGPVLGAVPALTGPVGFRKGVVLFFGPYIGVFLFWTSFFFFLGMDRGLLLSKVGLLKLFSVDLSNIRWLSIGIGRVCKRLLGVMGLLPTVTKLLVLC